MNTLLDALRKMIKSKKVYGTIVCHPDNLNIYWSPVFWYHPKEALRDCMNTSFIWLGTPGWWADETAKELYLALERLVGGYVHEPGAYDLWKDGKPVRFSWPSKELVEDRGEE